MDEAAKGIYSINVGKFKVPLLGTEIGRIPLRYPGKPNQKGSGKSQGGTESTAITTTNTENLPTPPRVPETYVDRFSVTDDFSSTAASKVASVSGGLTFDPNEHPLLCDLDETRDAVMYGRGKEFVENVKRVRSLLVGYHRWELTEKWYKWATVFLKLSIVFLIYAIWYQGRVCTVLMTSFGLYTAHTDRTMSESAAKRRESTRKAVRIAEAALSGAANLPATAMTAQTRVRRELLPESSDLSAVVKARMKAFHEAKHQQRVFPT